MAPYTQAAKGASAALKQRKAPGGGSAPGSPGNAAQAAVDRAKGALAKHRGAKPPMQSVTGGGLQGGPPAPAAPPSPSPQGGMPLPRALRQQVEAGAMSQEDAFNRAFQNRAGFRERAMQAIGQGPPPTMPAPADMGGSGADPRRASSMDPMRAADAAAFRAANPNPFGDAPGRMQDLVRSFPPGGLGGGMEFQTGGGLQAPGAGIPGQPGKGPAPMPPGAPFQRADDTAFLSQMPGGFPANLPPGLADLLAGGIQQMPGGPPGMGPKGPYYGPMPQFQPGGGGMGGGMGELSGGFPTSFAPSGNFFPGARFR